MMVDPVSEAYRAMSEPFSFTFDNVSATCKIICKLRTYKWVNGKIVHPLPHDLSMSYQRILNHGYAAAALLFHFEKRCGDKTCCTRLCSKDSNT